MAYDDNGIALEEPPAEGKNGEHKSPAALEREAERARMREAIREVAGFGFDMDTLPPGLKAEIAAKMKYDATPFSEDDSPENAFDFGDRMTLTEDERRQRNAKSGGVEEFDIGDDDDDDVPKPGRKKPLPVKIRKILDDGPKGSESRFAAAVSERREAARNNPDREPDPND